MGSWRLAGTKYQFASVAAKQNYGAI